MRPQRPLRLLPGFVATLVALAALAQGQKAAADDAQVVAKVGSIAITQADLRARLSRVPRMQLALLGNDDAAIKRAFLEKVMIPEVLFAESAKKRGVTERPDVHARVRDTYRTALLAKIREDVNAGITDADVQKFYEDNRSRFEARERIQIWRILVATKEDAGFQLIGAPGDARPVTRAASRMDLARASASRCDARFHGATRAAEGRG